MKSCKFELSVDERFHRGVWVNCNARGFQGWGLGWLPLESIPNHYVVHLNTLVLNYCAFQLIGSHIMEYSVGLKLDSNQMPACVTIEMSSGRGEFINSH